MQKTLLMGLIGALFGSDVSRICEAQSSEFLLAASSSLRF